MILKSKMQISDIHDLIVEVINRNAGNKKEGLLEIAKLLRVVSMIVEDLADYDEVERYGE